MIYLQMLQLLDICVGYYVFGAIKCHYLSSCHKSLFYLLLTPVRLSYECVTIIICLAKATNNKP